MSVFVIAVFCHDCGSQLYGICIKYTGWATKNVALYFCSYLCQLTIDFQNSFTDTLFGQFAICDCYISHHTVNGSLHYLVKC